MGINLFFLTLLSTDNAKILEERIKGKYFLTGLVLIALAYTLLPILGAPRLNIRTVFFWIEGNKDIVLYCLTALLIIYLVIKFRNFLLLSNSMFSSFKTQYLVKKYATGNTWEKRMATKRLLVDCTCNVIEAFLHEKEVFLEKYTNGVMTSNGDDNWRKPVFTAIEYLTIHVIPKYCNDNIIAKYSYKYLGESLEKILKKGHSLSELTQHEFCKKLAAQLKYHTSDEATRLFQMINIKTDSKHELLDSISKFSTNIVSLYEIRHKINSNIRFDKSVTLHFNELISIDCEKKQLIFDTKQIEKSLKKINFFTGYKFPVKNKIHYKVHLQSLLKSVQYFILKNYKGAKTINSLINQHLDKELVKALTKKKSK